MEEVIFEKPKVHIFICVNDRSESSSKVSCGPTVRLERCEES